MNAQHLDAVDLKLIYLLQENARHSIKHLAGEVFMSPPAVAARISRLEKAGFIQGYQPILDHQMLGYSIMAYISLQVNPVDKQRFNPYIASVPNVLECNCVTGDYSMLIKVCFESTIKLDTFIGELQKFGKTYTQIVFSSIVPPRSVKP